MIEMPVYTRTGDDGTTALGAGGRVSKADARIEAIGALDELSSWLGLVRAAGGDMHLLGHDGPVLGEQLREVQRSLFELGADLAFPPKPGTAPTCRLAEEAVSRLEDWIDRLEGRLPPLRAFVLPAGGEVAARLQVARAVCRRAERTVAGLATREAVHGRVLRYLNRLGDYLFVLARAATWTTGATEETWRGGSGQSAEPGAAGAGEVPAEGN